MLSSVLCSERARKFGRFVVVLAALLPAFATSTAEAALTCDAASVSGTVDGSSSTYGYGIAYASPRATVATCNAPGDYPGVSGSAGTTTFRHVEIPFRNVWPTPQCFTFTLTSSQPNLVVQAETLSPWYSPASEFLGFSGPTLSTNQTFAVHLEPHQSIYLVITDVVNTTGPAVSTDFTLTASNSSCPAVSVEVAPGSSVYGQSVTLSATLSGSFQAPAGTVHFKDNGNDIGEATLSGGQASLSTSALGVGPHSITAVYGGGGIYTSATSAAVAHTVSEAATTTTLASSSSPQVAGADVTFTATVAASPPGAGTPTGTVTFAEGGTSLATVTLGSSLASFTTSALAVGSHTIVATYSGDPNFESSTTTIEQTIEVRGTTMRVEATPSSGTFGDDVTLQATLSSDSGGVPTGSLVFAEAGTTIETVPLDGASASVVLRSLGVGPHTIEVTYAGDGSFGACAGSVTLSLDKAPTTTVVTSSDADTVVGQSVRLGATVATRSGTPTGTVTFRDGTTTLGTAELANGTATLDIDSLGVGAHEIRAVYAGDTNFSASTSAPFTQEITQEVTESAPPAEGAAVSGGSGCAATGAPLSSGGAILVVIGTLLARRRRAA